MRNDKTPTKNKGKTTVIMRPEIIQFAEAMELKMRKNDDKKGDSWKYMKASVLENIFVEDKHGMTKGRVLKTLAKMNWLNHSVWVMGDAGEKIRILPNEFQIIPEGAE